MVVPWSALCKGRFKGRKQRPVVPVERNLDQPTPASCNPLVVNVQQVVLCPQMSDAVDSLRARTEERTSVKIHKNARLTLKGRQPGQQQRNLREVN